MKYRPEIDGLRAIAIIPVLLFHSGLPYLTGGYLGVDVFFVISGFLITQIIITEINNENFSLLRFYERRARRILPALFAMIVFVSALTPVFIDSPKNLNEFGDSVLSVVFFISNVYFFLTSGYFGTVSELSPLLHTWSLAVEEQFYVIFPILAIACLYFGKKYLTVVIFLSIIVSILIAEWGWRNSPIGNFYLAPTRAWELLVGSLGAIYSTQKNTVLLGKIGRSILSASGLLMVLASYLTFTSGTPHPSAITLIPVIGTLLVILFSDHRNICGKTLNNRVLVHFGLISYSLYLWHQPILAFAKIETSPELDFGTQIFVFTLIYAISVLSYRYVETPFRNRKSFSRARIFKYSAASLFFMAGIGFLCSFNVSILKLFYPDNMKRYEMMLVSANSHEQQVVHEEECKFNYESLNHTFKKRFGDCSKKYGKAIVIIGGSHGIDLYNAIAINSKYKFIVGLTKGYCRAHDFIGPLPHKPTCQYQDFKNFSSTHAGKIMKVIYTQTPDRLYTKGMDYAIKTDLSLSHVNQVVDYLSSLKNDYDLDVLMVGMLPPMKKSPIDLDYREELKPQLERNFSDNALLLTKYTDLIFKEELEKHSINYISKFKGFGLKLPEDLISNGAITYSDRRHLSTEGEKLFGKRLVNKL